MPKAKDGIFAIGVLALLFIFVAGNPNPNIYPNAPSHSLAYQQSAKFFEASIDTSVNPCDDFYQYACGKYDGNISFMNIDNNNIATITEELKTANVDNLRPIKQAKAMYRQCLKDRSNWDKAVGNGTFLSNIVGDFLAYSGMPFPLFSIVPLSSWPHPLMITRAMGYLAGKFGVASLINPFVAMNHNNPMGPNPYFAVLGEPALTFSNDQYQGEAWEEAKPVLKKYINQIFSGYNNILNSGISDAKRFNKNSNSIDEAADEIANFEWYLANNAIYEADSELNLMSYETLKRRCQAFDFSTFLKLTTMQADPAVFKKISKPFYQFNIADPKGFAALNSALKNEFYGKFSVNVLGNYMYYSLIRNYVQYFPSFVHIDEPDQKSSEKMASMGYSKHINAKINATIVQNCYYATLKYFRNSLGRIFVEKKLPTPEKRERFQASVKYLIDNILVGMQSMIDGLSWMTPESKKFAYSKIQNLAQNFVFPDWMFNDEAFVKRYSKIDKRFLKSSLPEMEFYLMQFSLNKQFEQLLLTEMDRNVWDMDPTTVNAAYDPRFNSFVIPMGILQQPFYDPEWPTSVNYGGMGIVVGHELSHGFDTGGVNWGPFGEFQKWLDSESEKHFDEMADCVIQEYNRFCPLNSSYTPHCVIGKQTVPENIADNGGIHASYRAYRNIIDFYGPDPLLPGELASQFTHDQLFFLSFAQVWCQKPDSPESQHDQLLGDVHSPSKYRIHGTIRNFPAFRTAFNCPVGSASAPKDHCNVWISDVTLPQKPPSSDVLNIPETPTIKADNNLFTKYSQAQAFFQASMNLTADPCQNFYDYACGNNSHSAFGTVGGKSFEIMENALNEMTAPDYDGSMLESKAIKKTLTYYSKCKNQTSQKTNIAKQKLDEFEALTGFQFNWCDMTASTNNKANPTSMAKALAHLSVNYEIFTLITSGVEVNPRRDPRFSSNYTFIIDENSATYVKPYYKPGAWEKFTYDALKTNMQNLIQAYTQSIGMECKPNVLAYNVETIVEFEHLMATNFSSDEALQRNYSLQVNPMQIKDIPIKFVDWSKFISDVSNISDVDFLRDSKVEDYWVILTQPASMQAFDKYIPEVGMDVVVKYLYYRLLVSFPPSPPNSDSEEYVKLYPEFSTFGRDSLPKDPFFPEADNSLDLSSAACTSAVFEAFPYPYARIFTEVSYPSLAAKTTFKKKTFKIIDSIKNSMQSMLEDLPWISKDEKTLKGARDKIDNLQINAAFPDFMMDNSKLDEYYEDLDIQESDSMETMELRIRIFDLYNRYKGLLPGTPIDRSDFGYPMMVNAWYDPSVNSITIPAGILQQPFFDSDFPASINFGGIGVVIGHEITHGFDDEGIQFNGAGIQQTWMSEESQKIFNEMAECVVDEYGNFTIIDDPSYNPRNINGQNTQGENIADNGGIHAAYNSYRRWISLNGPDPQLPDRVFGQLTHDQLFFLSFAQPWCGAGRASNDYLFKRILSDPHSPAKYRVFGTVQNFPAFRDAFNCPLNSNYAPRKHCSVWVPNN